MVSRLKYKTEQDKLSYAAVQLVDAILSEALVLMTRNMHGYPKKLLYMTRGRGDLAMPLVRRWTNFKSFLSAWSRKTPHAHAADGVQGRLARKHGFYAIRG